jgi:arabinogalactan endo-1,4-beta-galactosidase
MEATGYRFRDNRGDVRDCLSILKDHGIDTVRLRVFVNPSQDPKSGHCSGRETAVMAARAAKMGFRVMIDFHYDDSWADPGQQTKPLAWREHGIGDLCRDVHEHTRDVLLELKRQGVTPEWVQVGNEISHGMLWPEGKTPAWGNLAALINAGYEAVKEVFPEAKVIVHLDHGADNAQYRWFFDNLTKSGGRFDVIGMSYYASALSPESGENLRKLGENLRDMAARHGKEVMVVETGELSSEPRKSREKLASVLRKVREVPGGKGLGVIYWEPEGEFTWSHYKMSAWGEDGRPTEALDAFLEPVSGPSRK